MRDPGRGVETVRSRRLNHEIACSNRLEDVLWEWTSVQERTARLWEWKDVPWWNLERAAIGSFAGAVWRSGGVALEEFPVAKSKDGRRKPGRCDLYVTLGDEHYVVEAKYCWASATSAQARDAVEKALAKATADVRCHRIKRREGERGLAIVFIVPYVSASRIESFDPTNWLEGVGQMRHDGVAWVFPSAARDTKGEDGHHYPGAALVIRVL